MSLICPRCGWDNIRPSKLGGAVDYVLAAFLLSPYRCRSCRARFYRYFGHANELEQDDAPESQLAERDYAEVRTHDQPAVIQPDFVPDPGAALEFEWMAAGARPIETIPYTPVPEITLEPDHADAVYGEPARCEPEAVPVPQQFETEVIEMAEAKPEPQRQPLVRAMAAGAGAGYGSVAAAVTTRAPSPFVYDEQALERLLEEAPTPGDRPYRRIRRALWEATFNAEPDKRGNGTA